MPCVYKYYILNQIINAHNLDLLFVLFQVYLVPLQLPSPASYSVEDPCCFCCPSSNDTGFLRYTEKWSSDSEQNSQHTCCCGSTEAIAFLCNPIRPAEALLGKAGIPGPTDERQEREEANRSSPFLFPCIRFLWNEADPQSLSSNIMHGKKPCVCRWSHSLPGTTPPSLSSSYLTCNKALVPKLGFQGTWIDTR